MIWNTHSKDVPEGAHAILGASSHSWLNYDKDKLFESWRRRYAQAIGTHAHDYAARYIRHGQKAKSGDKTGLFLHLLEHHIPANSIDINNLFKNWQLYVNDAVSARMRPEQVLYFSRNAFGTADAISFRKDELRIYDLKTGDGKTSMDQLYIYAALFCLEYDITPGDIDIQTRIYQFADYIEEYPTAEDILPIMDQIKTFDKLIDRYREEGRYEI